VEAVGSSAAALRGGATSLPVRPIGAEAVTGELFGMEPEQQLTPNSAAVDQAAWEAKAESSEPGSEPQRVWRMSLPRTLTLA
jgi:hypothetical protein